VVGVAVVGVAVVGVAVVSVSFGSQGAGFAVPQSQAANPDPFGKHA